MHAMQVTIDLPEKLALQVGAEGQRLAELLARALRPKPPEMSALRREVFSFFAHGPRPSEIVAFRPSEAATARMRELLRRNKEGSLSPAEEAEMDEIEEIDHMVSLIKAEAREYVRAPS
jgi:hypothetical protein